MIFKLLNREFSFEVDVSKLPCGTNGAVYFVEMHNVHTMLNLFPERRILMDGLLIRRILTLVQVFTDLVVLNLIYGKLTHLVKHSLHILVQQVVLTHAKVWNVVIILKTKDIRVFVIRMDVIYIHID